MSGEGSMTTQDMERNVPDMGERQKRKKRKYTPYIRLIPHWSESALCPANVLEFVLRPVLH